MHLWAAEDEFFFFERGGVERVKMSGSQDAAGEVNGVQDLERSHGSIP